MICLRNQNSILNWSHRWVMWMWTCKVVVQCPDLCFDQFECSRLLDYPLNNFIITVVLRIHKGYGIQIFSLVPRTFVLQDLPTLLANVITTMC